MERRSGPESAPPRRSAPAAVFPPAPRAASCACACRALSVRLLAFAAGCLGSNHLAFHSCCSRTPPLSRACRAHRHSHRRRRRLVRRVRAHATHLRKHALSTLFGPVLFSSPAMASSAVGVSRIGLCGLAVMGQVRALWRSRQRTARVQSAFLHGPNRRRSPAPPARRIWRSTLRRRGSPSRCTTAARLRRTTPCAGRQRKARPKAGFLQPLSLCPRPHARAHVLTLFPYSQAWTRSSPDTTS